MARHPTSITSAPSCGVDVLFQREGKGGGSKGRIKGVTANSLRNLAEIGNQPVDGTRRDLRWSLGGRGRVPRGTVPGGLYPHSEVDSGGLGCHDDHSRLLGQSHTRVEQGSRVGCVESSMTHRSPATSLPARRPQRRCVCADLTHPMIPMILQLLPGRGREQLATNPGNLVRCPLLTYDSRMRFLETPIFTEAVEELLDHDGYYAL